MSVWTYPSNRKLKIQCINLFLQHLQQIDLTVILVRFYRRYICRYIFRHKFVALLKELKVPPLNTPYGSKFHSRTAAGRNGRLYWSVQQHRITKANSPRAVETLVLRAAMKWFRYLCKGVRSVINLIEQTQGTDPPSVPQTTMFTLTQPFRTANYSIQ